MMSKMLSTNYKQTDKAGPLSREQLKLTDAYWRAANYLSVGRIYLYDNPLLEEPSKLKHFKPRLLGHWGTTPGLNFDDSALEFLFAVWCLKEDYFKLSTKIRQEIKEQVDAESIEIPFPHRTLYTGSVTQPLQVRIVNEQTEPH